MEALWGREEWSEEIGMLHEVFNYWYHYKKERIIVVY